MLLSSPLSRQRVKHCLFRAARLHERQPRRSVNKYREYFRFAKIYSATQQQENILSQMFDNDDNTPPGGGAPGDGRAVVQSNIKKDERFDIAWEGMPFKMRRIGRGPKAIVEKVCIMPVWLRNLWPTSDFDPCAVWEQARLL